MQVTNYVTIIRASCDIEELAFWQWNSRRFAMLSKLSASVRVEAVFSTTGLIPNGKAIGAGKLNKISFIHDNYAYLLNSY